MVHESQKRYLKLNCSFRHLTVVDTQSCTWHSMHLEGTDSGLYLPYLIFHSITLVHLPQQLITLEYKYIFKIKMTGKNLNGHRKKNIYIYKYIYIHIHMYIGRHVYLSGTYPSNYGDWDYFYEHFRKKILDL